MKTLSGTLAACAALTWRGVASAQDSAMAEDIRDIRGPIADPAPWWEIAAPYAAAGLGVTAAALLTWLIWRWVRRPKTADRIALARIERARKLATEGRVDAFADELSEAIRAYIEARFEVHAPRRTTEELLGELASDDASPLRAHRETLGVFLRVCDEAKFGGYDIEAEAIDSLANAARDFIAQTYAAKGPERESASAGAPSGQPVGEVAS